MNKRKEKLVDAKGQPLVEGDKVIIWGSNNPLVKFNGCIYQVFNMPNDLTRLCIDGAFWLVPIHGPDTSEGYLKADMTLKVPKEYEDNFEKLTAFARLAGAWL